MRVSKAVENALPVHTTQAQANDAEAAEQGDQGEIRLLRALQVLEALADTSDGYSLASLSEQLHIPKASLMRLLQAMEQGGYVQRTLGRQAFVSGPGMVRLSLRSLQQTGSARPYRPILRELVNRLGESCNLTVLAEEKVLYLDRVETTQPLRMTLPPGTRVPMHCTASGKLFLSEMDRRLSLEMMSRLALDRVTPQSISDLALLKAEIERTRSKGFGVDNEEFIRGMVAVAVPVRARDGRCLAAVACHAPTARCSLEDMLGNVGALKLAAARIADRLDGT